MLVGGVLLSVFVLFAAFCVGTPRYYGAKYAPVESAAMPAATPGEFQPQEQVEPHTCGLHSLSTIYLAYGLDPEAMNLRFRLGIDKPATNLDDTSRGLIHPDMLRVLNQDGFQFTLLDPQSSNVKDALFAHLDTGHPALALTQPAGLHWLVLSGREDESIVVCDSLAPERYRRDADGYLAPELYSLILVKPRETGDAVSSTDAHKQGLAEMLKVHDRMNRGNERE